MCPFKNNNDLNQIELLRFLTKQWLFDYNPVARFSIAVMFSNLCSLLHYVHFEHLHPLLKYFRLLVLFRFFLFGFLMRFICHKRSITGHIFKKENSSLIFILTIKFPESSSSLAEIYHQFSKILTKFLLLIMVL